MCSCGLGVWYLAFCPPSHPTIQCESDWSLSEGWIGIFDLLPELAISLWFPPPLFHTGIGALLCHWFVFYLVTLEGSVSCSRISELPWSTKGDDTLSDLTVLWIMRLQCWWGGFAGALPGPRATKERGGLVAWLGVVSDLLPAMVVFS